MTIQGVVDDGTATSPIPNATCQFVDQNDAVLSTAVAGPGGSYELQVDAGAVGSIICTLPDLPSLGLTTFISTAGLAQGSTLTGEDITPATTIVAYIISTTNPTNPQDTKSRLLGELAAGQPPEFPLLADVATIVFNAMRDASINIDFDNALDDILTDGRLSLQELQAIAPQVEQAIAAAEQQRGVTLSDARADLFGQDVPPVAADDAITTDEDTPVTGTLRASDANGDPLTFRITDNGTQGIATITDQATGAFTYTPNANANGTDAFRFVANDGMTDSSTATVMVTITPVNDPPVAADDSMIGTPVNTPVTVPVLANDVDVDGDPLTITAVTQGSMGGTVTINGQELTYAPSANFEGTDTFTYTVSDGQATDTATVTVAVSSSNRAPIAQNDAASTNEDTPVTIAVLQNDSDPDGDGRTIDPGFPLTPANGTATISDASVVYTPAANFFGTDAFSYRVCDNGVPVLCSSPAMVTITVNPVNDPPVAQNDAASTDEDTPVTIAVLQNDSDPENDTRTIDPSFPLTPGNGTATISDTSIIYTPAANFFGTDTFSYRVCDNGAPVLCSPAMVTITVNSVNDLPRIMRPPATQMNIVGRLASLNLKEAMVVEDIEDTDCATCTFTVSNIPPNLTMTGSVLTGNIAFNAFSRGDNGPSYNVRVTVEDRDGGVASETFTWRVAQEQVEVVEESEGGGDGDGDGDGDGGAEGDAGDGGDASPMAGATCRLVDMEGHDVLDNQGDPIQRPADANGRFVLPLPEQDPTNTAPDAPLRALEGFIECHPPDKENLTVSFYLNTTGLRRNERIRNLKVDPTTTVSRQLCDSLNSVDAKADMVAIQARFLDDISELQTGSPREMTEEKANEQGCDPPTPVEEVTESIDIPLQVPPANESKNRVGMTAYIASQLYLAAFKGDEVGRSKPIGDSPGDCDSASNMVDSEDFRAILAQYYSTGNVSDNDLVALGLKPDEVLVTGPYSFSCD